MIGNHFHNPSTVDRASRAISQLASQASSSNDETMVYLLYGFIVVITVSTVFICVFCPHIGGIIPCLDGSSVDHSHPPVVVEDTNAEDVQSFLLTNFGSFSSLSPDLIRTHITSSVSTLDASLLTTLQWSPNVYNYYDCNSYYSYEVPAQAYADLIHNQTANTSFINSSVSSQAISSPIETTSNVIVAASSSSSLVSADFCNTTTDTGFNDLTSPDNCFNSTPDDTLNCQSTINGSFPTGDTSHWDSYGNSNVTPEAVGDSSESVIPDAAVVPAKKNVTFLLPPVEDTAPIAPCCHVVFDLINEPINASTPNSSSLFSEFRTPRNEETPEENFARHWNNFNTIPWELNTDHEKRLRSYHEWRIKNRLEEGRDLSDTSSESSHGSMDSYDMNCKNCGNDPKRRENYFE